MSGDDNTGETEQSSVRRRSVLGMAGLGAVGALSGCLGDGDGDEEPQDTPSPRVETVVETVDGGEETVVRTETVRVTDEETDSPTETDRPFGSPFVEGQEFRFASDTDPLEASFLGVGPWDSYYDSQLSRTTFGPLVDEYVVIRDPPVGERQIVEGRMFDDWTLNLDEGMVEVHIREDGKWSDGTHVTAADYLAQAAFFRLAELSGPDGNNSFYPKIGSVGLRWSWEDFEVPDGMDGKTVRFTADRDGAWDHIKEFGALFHLSGLHMAPQPAHKEPISSLLEVALENLEAAQENPTDLDAWDQREAIMNDVVTDEDLENWRDPDFAVFNGPWQLANVRGSQEVILEPNPHYYEADQINWDRIVYEFTPDENRQKAALQSGLLDAAQVQFTSGAIGSLPDKYEQINYPSGGPGVIGFDHTHFAWQHHEVRQAVAYAIDSQAVANNHHPDGTEPINVPGGDNAFRSQVISDEWVDNNLIDYSQDLDMAASKMQEAGFSKNSNGVWESEDGTALAPTLYTYRGDPVFEQTVADQLSQFGIDTSVQPLDESAYGSRFKDGELDFFVPWRGPYLANPYGDLGHFFYATNIHKSWENTWNYYSSDAQADMFEAFGESGWIGGNTAATEQATVQAPPVGEPDGDLQTWRPTFWYASATFGNEGPWHPKNPENYYKPLSWILNWYMFGVPIFNEVDMNWINAQNWSWPRDDPTWEFMGGRQNAGNYISRAKLLANADNPKDGANVD